VWIAMWAWLMLWEVQVTVRLVRLLFHPAGEPIPLRLASACFYWLLLLPGIIIGAFWNARTNDHSRFSSQPLFKLMFSPWSAGFVLFALVSLGAWLWFVLRRPARLYASPLVVAPLVLMATIYLTFSILYACSLVDEMVTAPLRVPTPTMDDVVIFGAIWLMAPLVAIVNLVLLIMHVARTQIFRRRACDAGPDETGER